MPGITVIDFYRVPLVRLNQTSGDLVEDTVSLLQALLDLLPEGEAQFDVHVALAEIYMQTDRFEQARFELEMASQVKPDIPIASRDLAETFAELERSSYPEGLQIQHAVRHDLGHVLAFLGYSVHPTSVSLQGTFTVGVWWEALGKMDKDYSAFLHIVDSNDFIWGQKDLLLRQASGGGYATSSWEEGEKVAEKYELVLSPDVPAGEYIINVGVYYWETGERLPAFNENGERLPDDAISLGSITVHE